MYGASGDAHLRMEVPRACRGPSFALEALWRNGRVHIYRDLRAELLQLARVVTRDVAVRGLGARLAWAVWLEIPGRGVVVCHVNAYTSLNGVTGVTDRRYYPAALSVVSTLL